MPVTIIKTGPCNCLLSCNAQSAGKGYPKSALCSTDVGDVEQIALERASSVAEYNQHHAGV